MTAQALYWFHIEPVLSMIRQFEARVRASVAARGPSGPLSAPPAPNLEEEVTRVTGFGRPLAWNAPGATGLASEDALSLDIVKLRAELRDALRRMESRLGSELGKAHVQNILHPIVIHADEQLSVATLGRAEAWAPLQLELFKHNNGGEIFYQLLDDLMKQPDTPNIVLASFYYCLRDGFRGETVDHPSRNDDYQQELSRRLVVEGDLRPRHEADAGIVELYEFPWRYYLWGLGLVVGTALLLWLLGYLQV